MSVKSEITRINTNIAAAYAAASDKGAAMPQTQNSANLAATINSISGEKDIIAYDQRNAKVRMYLADADQYNDYPDYASSGYDPTQDNTSYQYSVFNDTGHAHYNSYHPVDRVSDSKPSGVTVTLPSSGTLVIRDGIRSMSYAVSAGEQTIYNLTPGSIGAYYLKGSNDQLVDVGLLKPSGSLRMIYCKLTQNVRDLGGWACDGGTVKYGKLFRGAKLFSGATGDSYQNDINFDKSVLHDLLGIRYELDLRNTEDIDSIHIGEDVGYTNIPGTMYVINDSQYYDKVHARYAKMLNCVIDCMVQNRPLYFHCAQGADRTGILAMLIEAILGVSPKDIDKDYEITTFNTGNDTDKMARRRNENAWRALMFGSDGVDGISSYTGSTLRDKVVSWALSLVPEEGTSEYISGGFEGVDKITIDRLNAFRAAMIDGTPDVLTPSL